MDCAIVAPPCPVCGAPSVAAHYDFATDRVRALCKPHKDAALNKDLEDR